MDIKTAKELQRVSEQIDKTGGEKEVDINKDLRQALNNMSKDHRLSLKQKDQIKKILDQPEMYETRKQIDYQRAKEIEQETERAVKQLIRSGRIPPPKIDSFIKKTISNINKKR